MSGSALSFVGKMVILSVFDCTCICKNKQLKYAPFCDFQMQIQKMLVHKYVFEPIPVLHNFICKVVINIV